MNVDNKALNNIIYDKDFIVIYSGLDRGVCNNIINLFNNDQRKWRGRVGKKGNDSLEDLTKNSWDLEILNEDLWQDIFQKINPIIQSCIAQYVSKSPVLQSFDLIASGYKIQMYPKNQGYFQWHADSVGGGSGDRVVAMVLYLNDVEDGGETEFFHQEIKIIPKAGCLVLFPAGWNYMHCAHVPKSNDKYIISTFIKVKAE